MLVDVQAQIDLLVAASYDAEPPEIKHQPVTIAVRS
jgi:hypothetical protein